VGRFCSVSEKKFPFDGSYVFVFSDQVIHCAIPVTGSSDYIGSGLLVAVKFSLHDVSQFFAIRLKNAALSIITLAFRQQ
jgi:hypothetical protein